MSGHPLPGPLRLKIDGATFRDWANREIYLRGINVAADAKFPRKPDVPGYKKEGFFEGDKVSFVGRPFALDEAERHLTRLRRWGFNAIRYVFTWEAIEHEGPGIYDEEWIQHTISLLKYAKQFGFRIFMDPHQDVWSRFTGGSGAPMWTVYACGLDPTKFLATQAALVHNTWPNPAEFPKMIWATNYQRLACQVIFTCFFGGRDFAPKAVIDGKNIQDYLQDHFVGAVRHLAQRLKEAGGLLDENVIGWESINEPNRGLLGWQDISVIPSEQKLKKGTAPTAWQAILNGSGRACEMDTWDFGGMGPYRSGTETVDPKGVLAWLPADFDDTRYGWTRSSDWKLGECLWAQHGVWDPSSDELLKNDYFGHTPSGEKIDAEFFTNHYFMDFYRNYAKAIKSVHPDAIMLCEPPVLEIPPSIKGTEDDDPNMVFAPHYYDGVTLMTKKWNRYWNVDVFGILRGKYLSPAFAIKVGETAIRNCLKDQLSAIRKEGMEYMGERPTVFTEIGIPFDMDDHYAYKTGDYSSQSAAMDANMYAVEGSGANGLSLWTYMCTNLHEWGDLWNGEDLSIFSLDDKPLPLHPNPNATHPSHPHPVVSHNRDSPSYSESQSGDAEDTTADHNGNYIDDASASASPVSSRKEQPFKTPTISTPDKPGSAADLRSKPGYRAAEAFVRPSPLATVGRVITHAFDLRSCHFEFVLHCEKPATEDAPTVLFLPEFHFPPDRTHVDASSGTYTISIDKADKTAIQRLRWVHDAGRQTLKVRGLHRPQALYLDDEGLKQSYTQGDGGMGGYLEQCRQHCILM